MFAANFFPPNPFSADNVMQTGAGALVTCRKGFLPWLRWTAVQAVLGLTTAVKAAVTDNGATQVITTGFTAPPCCRNITITYGGTATDIKGGHQVTVEGTDYSGAAISEVMPVATVDTAGTVVGNLAFATVTKATIPAHDGLGATTAIGFGAKLGLPFLLPHNTVQDAYRGNTREGTAPTVTTSTTVLAANTMTLNSALNGTVVDAYLFV